jgi:hypothetical protein
VLERILLGAVGVTAILLTVSSAVRTVILPRSAQSFLSRIVFRATRYTFRVVSRLRPSFDWVDRVMAYFAPTALLSLAALWILFLGAGYTLVFQAIAQGGWADAFHKSGSSLLTLGFAAVAGTEARAVAFTEAALGIGMLALLITYLPTMYAAFADRERLVALLESRAGSPPSAIEMLERAHRIGWVGRLGDSWRDWENWFAAVEESHTTYPVLAFYRSPQPDRHWVSAAGTVLDAAALSLSTIEVPNEPQAALMLRAGYLSLRHIADFYGIEYKPEPEPMDPISIARSEWDEAVGRLEAAGIPLKEDREQAWRDFSGWRVNYDTVLLSLAVLTMAPYAPWTSDRSAVGHRRVRVRRWGTRR